ncbi:SynChlorMet cassette protein ScmC, partial [Candidatus Fermentibacteria bacterium]|nr:SynChlorMet cassette protein ScmC [Candidatus Fermentibacteria bacterium]
VEVDPGLLEHPEIRVIAMWTALRSIQFQAIAAGGGPFHATLAAHQGRGVLIAAPAGMGKSTCYRRLPPPWEPLCDDYALVVQHGPGQYAAHPFPTFSEYLESKSSRTWLCCRSAPLSAVFFLEQGNVDHVEPLAPHQMLAMLFDAQQQLLSTVLSRLDPVVAQDLRARLFENACAMAGAVSAYRLTATLTGRFWEHIGAVLPHCP